jgi:methylglutaconyl-CoA hydratase
LSELLLVNKDNPQIAVITLNRPEKRNALSIALMQRLIEQIHQLDSDGQTRVIVLCGAGAVFCAGLDLAEAQDESLVEKSAECVALTLNALKFSGLVSIAAVNGGAYAGGAGLVAACDIAIGSTDCQIGFPEARRGLLPALICDVLCTKLGEGDLTELFLVGDPIGAQRAQMLGLLQRVVDPNSVLQEAERIANGILAGGPQTIRDTKHLLHVAYRHRQSHTGPAGSVRVREDSVANDSVANEAVTGDSVTAGSVTEAQARHSVKEHLKARFSLEATEGLKAFIEKRPPYWMINR